MFFNSILKIGKFLLRIIPPLWIVFGVLFWPFYQKIPVKSLEYAFNEEVPADDLNHNVIKIKQPFNLPINEEYLNHLPFYIPLTRHSLCFNNNNKVYLIHSDSMPGLPFYSPNLSKDQYIKENHIGAMEIILKYDDSSENKFYRNIGDDFCEDFDLKKINSLATSTIEYKYMSLEGIAKLDLGNDNKLMLQRTIAKTFIDTRASNITIKAKWAHLIIVLIVLFYAWTKLLNFLFKLSEQIKTKIRKRPGKLPRPTP